MLLNMLRNGFGNLLIYADRLTRPTPVVRSPVAQQAVAKACNNLALYQFHACPFCIKTRRVIHHLNLPIELREASPGSAWREELEKKGGKVQVPCLKIIDMFHQEVWLYESNDIIRYLNEHFSVDGT
jgi:glutaredoxin